jgi:LPS sulfotransferase NodH
MLDEPGKTASVPQRKVPQDLCHRYFDSSPQEGHPEACYLICSTPRSGSTLLSHLLAGTGQHGVPHEYLNQHSCMRVLAQRYGLIEPGAALPAGDEAWVARYLAALISRRTAANGVFGMKMHFDQFAPFRDSPSISGFVKRSKCILILRSDLLGQAASFERAVQTRAWRSALREQKEAIYDRAALLRRMNALAGQATHWTNYLKAHRLPFMQVTYEDLCSDAGSVLQSVGAFLGAPISPDAAGHLVASVPLKVQRDATTDEWRQRFLAGEA